MRFSLCIFLLFFFHKRDKHPENCIVFLYPSFCAIAPIVVHLAVDEMANPPHAFRVSKSRSCGAGQDSAPSLLLSGACFSTLFCVFVRAPPPKNLEGKSAERKPTTTGQQIKGKNKSNGKREESHAFFDLVFLIGPCVFAPRRLHYCFFYCLCECVAVCTLGKDEDNNSLVARRKKILGRIGDDRSCRSGKKRESARKRRKMERNTAHKRERDEEPMGLSCADARDNNDTQPTVVKRQRREGDALPLPNDAVGLLDLPAEVLDLIVSHLSHADLARAGRACRALACICGQDRHWEALYRRFTDASGPPSEHADFALHGKTYRWLYALVQSTASGHHLPSLCGRLLARTNQDGARMSGEFKARFDPATGHFGLVLDGYGARTTDETVAGALRGAVQEGIWRAGVFVGPGRSAVNGVVTRSDAFDASGRARGRGTITSPESVYEGDLVGGVPHGRGAITYRASGNVTHGEWEHGVPCGRAVVATGDHTVDSVQYANGRVEGLFVSLKVPKNGTIVEAAWDYRRSLPPGEPTAYRPWSILHCTAMRLGAGTWRRLSTGGGAAVLHDITDREKHTAERGNSCAGMRISCNPLGGRRIVISGCCEVISSLQGGILFIAVSDRCDDRRLAGSCLLVDSTWMPTGTTASPFSVPSDLGTHEARLLALFASCMPTSPILDARGPLVRHGELVDAATRAQASLDWTANDDALCQSRGVGLAFGVTLENGRVEKEHQSETDPTASIARRVRCFLSGCVVPASECVLLSSGSLYAASHLARWRALAHWGNTDPRTGEPLAAPQMAIGWREWMAKVPPKVLASAAHDLGMALRDRRWDATLMPRIALHTLVVTLAGMLDCLPEQTTGELARGLSDLDANASAAYVADSIDDVDDAWCRGATIVPGPFAGLRAWGVEIRHPQWNPRGPWRLGSPPAIAEIASVPPHPFEGASDSRGAAQDYRDHGILWLALTAPCFVGARLCSIYFFGQTFVGASFVGATLDRCAFIGCSFRDCLFARTLVVDCRFYDCRSRGESITHDDAVARINADLTL